MAGRGWERHKHLVMVHLQGLCLTFGSVHEQWAWENLGAAPVVGLALVLGDDSSAKTTRSCYRAAKIRQEGTLRHGLLGSLSHSVEKPQPNSQDASHRNPSPRSAALQILAGESPPSAPHPLALCSRSALEVATAETLSWVTSVPPSCPSPLFTLSELSLSS